MSTPSGCWPRSTGCLAAAAGEERWPCERAGWLCGSWFGVAGLDDDVSSRFEPPTITWQPAQDEALPALREACIDDVPPWPSYCIPLIMLPERAQLQSSELARGRVAKAVCAKLRLFPLKVRGSFLSKCLKEPVPLPIAL